MKKTILALAVGVLAVGVTHANEDFKMFSEKKLQSTATEKKTINPLAIETKPVSQSTVVYAVSPNGTTAVATPTNQQAAADLNRMVAEQSRKQQLIETQETPMAIETKESWFSKYKNTQPNGLSMFKDNGVASSASSTQTVPALNANDQLFFDTLKKMDSIHASSNSSSPSNQAKLKSYDYTIYELAEKGNVNAIDYLCLNPKDSAYIQVSTMKYYCDLASINGHVEFLGFRAWEDDELKVKVSNHFTERRHQDYVVQKALNQNASWARVLEAKRISGDSIKSEVHQKLHDKKSDHWLHHNALDYFHKEVIGH